LGQQVAEINDLAAFRDAFEQIRVIWEINLRASPMRMNSRSTAEWIRRLLP
jgi:hypothetical protein